MKLYEVYQELLEAKNCIQIPLSLMESVYAKILGDTLEESASIKDALKKILAQGNLREKLAILAKLPASSDLALKALECLDAIEFKNRKIRQKAEEIYVGYINSDQSSEFSAEVALATHNAVREVITLQNTGKIQENAYQDEEQRTTQDTTMVIVDANRLCALLAAYIPEDQWPDLVADEIFRTKIEQDGDLHQDFFDALLETYGQDAVQIPDKIRKFKQGLNNKTIVLNLLTTLRETAEAQYETHNRFNITLFREIWPHVHGTHKEPYPNIFRKIDEEIPFQQAGLEFEEFIASFKERMIWFAHTLKSLLSAIDVKVPELTQASKQFWDLADTRSGSLGDDYPDLITPALNPPKGVEQVYSPPVEFHLWSLLGRFSKILGREPEPMLAYLSPEF
jgi:hypothetical protein